MIRVNLLPQEYRKAEGTPLKQFFATVGAVVLGVAVAGFWTYLYFGKLGTAKDELRDLEAAVASQKAGLERVKALDARLKELKTQYGKIDEIAKNRVVWSRKLDELWEIVVNPKAANRYEVWLKGISCQTAPPGSKGAVGGTVQFAGSSAGAPMYRLVDFHEDLSTSSFFKDFQKITPPYGSREPLPGDDKEPKEGWTFDFQLSLMSLEDIAKARKAEVEETGKK
jgi:Tfp pilus assembly protein PilN